MRVEDYPFLSGACYYFVYLLTIYRLVWRVACEYANEFVWKIMYMIIKLAAKKLVLGPLIGR